MSLMQLKDQKQQTMKCSPGPSTLLHVLMQACISWFMKSKGRRFAASSKGTFPRACAAFHELCSLSWVFDFFFFFFGLVLSHTSIKRFRERLRLAHAELGVEAVEPSCS